VQAVRSSQILLGAAILLSACGIGLLTPSTSAHAQSLARDGTVEIAGRALSCGRIRVSLDRRIPSEGAAAPGMLILNPRLLSAQPQTVRLFVFYHECGHHNVGESELKADCWAIERGVQDGWLDQRGIREVCQSFDGMPETDTHPSAKRRCRNLDQCFAASVAAHRPPATAAGRAEAAPRLVSGPTLVGTGTIGYSGR
jgi:hypothetical protein